MYLCATTVMAIISQAAKIWQHNTVMLVTMQYERMLTRRDTEATENLPTYIQMLPMSLQLCEAPNKPCKHSKQLVSIQTRGGGGEEKLHNV